MSFDEQELRRKMSIFRQSLRFQETSLNVFVQKIPLSYVKRALAAGDEDDPLVAALQSLDDTFRECRDKQVDVASSVEALLTESDARSGSGIVVLCWRLTFNAEQRRLNRPSLVGICTLFDFVSTSSFSTDAKSMARGDYNLLRPFFDRNYAYIDAMCSKSHGVGRLLVLHAYNYALSRKKRGLIALAYSARKNAVPESKRVFETLNFTAVIPEANFTVRMYGTWYKKEVDEVDLSGLADDAIRVCTRAGLTARTANSIVWRCPR